MVDNATSDSSFPMVKANPTCGDVCRGETVGFTPAKHSGTFAGRTLCEDVRASPPEHPESIVSWVWYSAFRRPPRKKFTVSSPTFFVDKKKCATTARE
eukprot:gene14169-4158_t